MTLTVNQAAGSLRVAIREATAGLVDREQLAELMILAAVAQEHLLVVGPPGTAKSAVVRRVAQSLGGQYFEYLLGRFTEPSELFGPVNLGKLREGLVETDVAGMLPEAEIAFLDEVFLGSTAILNTLLGLLNERQFRRGHTRIACPLRVCVGAANSLPEDEGLAAFADRFLLHVFVEPVADHRLEDLLAGGWAAGQNKVTAAAELSSLDVLNRAVSKVDLDSVHMPLAQAIRLLRQAHIPLSDRRIVKAQQLIAAATVLAGRETASRADLWPLLYVIPTAAGQHSAREVLRELLAEASHPLLHAVVEQVAQQPLARLSRLAESADLLLADGSSGDARPKFEALLREIDANFDPEQMPPELGERRKRLVAAVSGV
ncbi:MULTISPECIES: AAA family ATPase [Herbaspirillum]|jgi:MoxR-like ATPase|uniref:AAA family ATPase n=1 Tax=Herbaspirillum TaxID=963 RepID=UPI000347D17C|nr:MULTISPECIES: AAA family ATPase [unclassified Herbaspirillum]MCP3654222.1 AAA domain-containing protein [Herbaspirillum sp.]MCP3947375.1 AAA domain-containing protein [Herbaspirillum sp.]MCP4031751.1 AAA domain-containing protein [Herbaspirillum sp.]MCP4555128.1 AAA domain-containing protein [Herbaspirillum sp.]